MMLLLLIYLASIVDTAIQILGFGVLVGFIVLAVYLVF